VSVYYGSALSPLLFTMMLAALSSNFRIDVPWELLYCMWMIADSMEKSEVKFKKWRDGMESKGLRVNVNKTKVMVSGVGYGVMVASGEWPYTVCKKSIRRNSIICYVCDGWVHKRCIGVYGRLWYMTDFEYATCRGNFLICNTSPIPSILRCPLSLALEVLFFNVALLIHLISVRSNLSNINNKSLTWTGSGGGSVGSRVM